MKVVSNNFAQIAEALKKSSEEASQNISENAVQHIKDRIVANGQVNTGAMLNSVEAIHSQNDSYDVTVGADYAIYQNYGTKFIPPRPFFEPGIEDTKPDIDSEMQKIVDSISRVQ